MITSATRYCPVCGKEFDVGFYIDYAYKKRINGQVVLYCGYNCMRTVEKEIEALNKPIIELYDNK